MGQLKAALQNSFFLSVLGAFALQWSIAYENSRIYLFKQAFLKNFETAFSYSLLGKLTGKSFFLTSDIYSGSACIALGKNIYGKISQSQFFTVLETSLLFSLLKKLRYTIPLSEWEKNSRVTAYLDNHCKI